MGVEGARPSLAGCGGAVESRGNGKGLGKAHTIERTITTHI